MDNLLQTEKVYTVLELNTIVRDVIRSEFPNYIWVAGEIQGLRPERSKRHIYFELVQKHVKEDSIAAKVKIALFAGRRPLIQRRIQEAEGAFELKNDIEVKLLCEVSLHPPTGQYSLIVIDIDTVYTLGKVAQNRLKIIEDLKKQGLLDKNKLQNIPPIPLNIGLITAYDSAAYHDFTNELKISGYSFKILAYNCHMQGGLVEADVVEALGFFNKLDLDKLDVIVITRGGGSIADLSYFDNKKIAQTIANSNFAVISAIGHQINTTIADMVSHTFYKTPTKAAQFLTEKIKEAEDNINYLQEEIIKRADSFVADKRGELQNLTVKMESQSLKYFRLHREELLSKKHKVLSAWRFFLSEKKDSLKIAARDLRSSLVGIFKHLKDNLKYKEGKLKILDPKNILKRGYSITFKGKRAVKSIDDIAEGDMIRTVLYKGSIESKVKKVKD